MTSCNIFMGQIKRAARSYHNNVIGRGRRVGEGSIKPISYNSSGKNIRKHAFAGRVCGGSLLFFTARQPMSCLWLCYHPHQWIIMQGSAKLPLLWLKSRPIWQFYYFKWRQSHTSSWLAITTLVFFLLLKQSQMWLEMAERILSAWIAALYLLEVCAS